MLETIKETLESGNLIKAKILLDENKDFYHDDALFYLYEGVYFAQNKEPDLAELSFLKAIHLNQELIAAHTNLALIYYQKKDIRAKEHLLTSTWLSPENEQTYQLLFEKNAHDFKYEPAEIVLYTGTPWLVKKFSPDSLNTALGGSETAFVVMAQNLSRLGKKVVCFCNTPSRKKYDGVEYIPVVEFFVYNAQHHIPVFISSRFLHPFLYVKADKKYLWLHETKGAVDTNDIKEIINDLNGIFVLSDYQLHSIRDYHNLSKDKFIKTRNGFIAENFSKELKSKTKHSLIYFSRPERGLKEALLVFEKLKIKFKTAILHVCTYTQMENLEEDEYFKPLLPLLKNEGVVFHGGLSKTELAKLLEKMEIFIYPNVSDAETSCIAAMEAMAAGCVVVTSDRGAVKETIVDDVGGKVVSFSNNENFIDELTFQIEKLWENENELKLLSQSAFKKAWQDYPWNDVAKDWLEVFGRKELFRIF